MRWRCKKLLGAVTGVLAISPVAALAQDGEVAALQRDLFSRPALMDGAGTPKEALRARGIVVDGSVTQFYQGLVSGNGNKEWQYGGKGDVIATFDGAQLGLWRGLYVNVHQEWVWGEDVNNQADGSLLPVNAATGFPRLGGYDRDTSLVITQIFNEQFSISAGKFNMLDAAAKTPLIGGGGLDTFTHVGLAAPVSGVTPPYIVGTSLTFKTEPAIFNVLIYDPRSAQDWGVVSNPFAEGTTTSVSVTIPVKLFGLTGYQGLRGVHSSQEGFDLATIPQLFLPPDSDSVLDQTLNYWYFAYSFQQYLYQNPANPQEAWGVFGQVAFSDANPNPIRSSWYAGVGGNSFLPGRSSDRWGIAYFRYNLSDDLLSGLSALGINIRDEHGAEAYYNLAVTPWFRLTANVEYIVPFRPDREDAVFTGLRSQMKF
jgi:porin